MITYEDAFKIAKGQRTNLNQVAEYTNGFVFSNTDDRGHEGGLDHSPIVVLRKNGEVITMMKFVNSGTGKMISKRAI